MTPEEFIIGLTVWLCTQTAEPKLNDFWYFRDQEEATAFLAFWCDLIDEGNFERSEKSYFIENIVVTDFSFQSI